MTEATARKTMMEMLTTINEMIARSEERQRILREMIAETNRNAKYLEGKIAAVEVRRSLR